MEHLTLEQCLAWKRAGFPQEVTRDGFSQIYEPSVYTTSPVSNSNDFRGPVWVSKTREGANYIAEYIRIPTLAELLDFVEGKGWWVYADEYDDREKSIVLYEEFGSLEYFEGKENSWLLALHDACVKAGIVEGVEK